MTMNPWLAEQLVTGRRRDLERAAGTGNVPLVSAAELDGPVPVRHRRPAVARHVGILLMAVGYRLAEGDGFPAALEGSRRS